MNERLYRRVRTTTYLNLVNLRSLLRLNVGAFGLACLSACASSGNRSAEAPSTNFYISHAAGDYRPPGPTTDPWGPYVKIAADRFDVPEQWIRQVMQVESGGHEYIGGQLTISPAGAMGLMQLEPETYREMASRYALGQDPFDPYDNIMAGAGYIHAMYEVYGSPGFLAAYDAGPGRLDKYMEYHRALPLETTNYVAMIAPQIRGFYPSHRSEADQLALNTLPATEAPGLLPAGFAPDKPNAPNDPAVPTVEIAALDPPSTPEPSVYTPRQVSSAPVPPRQQNLGFAIISSAMADTTAPRSMQSSGTGWAIQVGAYNTISKANAALGIAELSAVAVLVHGQPVVVPVHVNAGMMYRARVVGMPHEQAVTACQRLLTSPTGCVILSPDAQS